MTDTLPAELAARGYTIDETIVNARGRVVLVVSGAGLDRFPMTQADAQDLASGEVTAAELHQRREHFARMRE